jgi:hypothetical protein
MLHTHPPHPPLSRTLAFGQLVVALSFTAWYFTRDKGTIGQVGVICHVIELHKICLLSIFPMPRTKSGFLTLFTHTWTGLFAQRITCFPFMVYLISCIYDIYIYTSQGTVVWATKTALRYHLGKYIGVVSVDYCYNCVYYCMCIYMLHAHIPHFPLP